MYYYQHHIGDYRKDTAHLTLLEHGIYRQLLDLYYTNEQPLSLDHASNMRLVCVRTADESKAYENVIKDFFFQSEDGLHHKRCDDEILKFHGKSEKSRDAAYKRWQNNANAMPTHSERNARDDANQEPITNNQEPITNNQEPRTKKEHKAQAPKYDFAKELKDLGATDEGIKTWMEVRKKKKAVNSEIALEAFKREASKAGLCIADAVLICGARSWSGLDAEWLAPRGSTQARPEKFDPTAYVNRNRTLLKEIK